MEKSELQKLAEVQRERVDQLNKALQFGQVLFPQEKLEVKSFHIIDHPVVLTQTTDARNKPVPVGVEFGDGSRKALYSKPLKIEPARKEASISEKINTSGIAETYNVIGMAKTSEDQVVILTEIIKFTPLANLKVDNQVKLERLVVDYCEALTVLHDQLGVIHNDLHNKNSGITPEGKVIFYDWEDAYDLQYTQLRPADRQRAIEHDYRECMGGIRKAARKFVDQANFWNDIPEFIADIENMEERIEIFIIWVMSEINAPIEKVEEQRLRVAIALFNGEDVDLDDF